MAVMSGFETETVPDLMNCIFKESGALEFVKVTGTPADDVSIAISTAPLWPPGLPPRGDPGSILVRGADLSTSACRASGEPQGWFYDPPLTVPFLRLNEVAVSVERR